MESESESLLLILLSSEFIFSFISVLILVISSGLVSGAEVAYFSLSANDYEKIAQENRKKDKVFLTLKNQPRKLLATILISNNFINIAIVILSESLLNILLPTTTFLKWAELFFDNEEQAAVLAKAFSFLITVVGVTGLLLLFGEIMPKVYAKINNVRLARFMAKPLHFLMQLFRPFIFALVNWTNLIETRIFQVTPPGSITSKEDIDEAINLTVSHEINSSKEVDLLRSILKFGEVSVKQIMQPRVDVVAVDNKTNYEELLEVIKSSGYSRIPVYQNDFDNVIGILYAKDLIGKLNESPTFQWTSLIRTNVLYVPEAKKISDLLKRFQKERLHMAIVVDEYGGSAGIVTLEDIMEEVIGDIRDEFDDGVEVDYIKLDDQTYIFDGKTLLNDVCRVLNINTNSFDLIKGEADSLAGMLLEINGSFPKKDAEITYNQFKFTVANITNRRIAKVKLKLL